MECWKIILIQNCTIQYAFEDVFECCASDNPFEIFDNTFLFRLIFLYMRRKGKQFVKNVMGESLLELFSNEDIEVPLVLDMNEQQQKPTESNKAPPRVSTNFLFFQNTCATNNGDVSPMSPDYITSSNNNFTISKSMGMFC